MIYTSIDFENDSVTIFSLYLLQIFNNENKVIAGHRFSKMQLTNTSSVSILVAKTHRTKQTKSYLYLALFGASNLSSVWH
jgi:hypothetical protein